MGRLQMVYEAIQNVFGGKKEEGEKPKGVSVTQTTVEKVPATDDEKDLAAGWPFIMGLPHEGIDVTKELKQVQPNQYIDRDGMIQDQYTDEDIMEMAKEDDEDKKVASENHLVDAYIEGFVKECEARGVDSEQLVAILFHAQELENE